MRDAGIRAIPIIYYNVYQRYDVISGMVRLKLADRYADSQEYVIPQSNAFILLCMYSVSKARGFACYYIYYIARARASSL